MLGLRLHLLAILLILAVLIQPWFAAPAPVYAQESLTAQIDETAHRIAGGRAVRIAVEVTCTEGLQVLEAFAYVSQAGVQSQFVPLTVTCDGRTRTSRLTIPAPDGLLFQPGEATISAFILVLDPTTGGTQSASPSRTVTLR